MEIKNKNYGLIFGGIFLFLLPFIFLYFSKPLLALIAAVAWFCTIFWFVELKNTDEKDRIAVWILFVIILLLSLYVILSPIFE